MTFRFATGATSFVRTPAATAVVALLLLAASCQSPTQMRMVLRTDMACDTASGAAYTLNDLSIYVARDDATLQQRMRDGIPAAYMSSCTRGAGGELGTLYLTPDGSDTGMVAVMAGLVHTGAGTSTRQSAQTCTSAVQENCLLSTRRFRYSAHQTGVVPVLLEASCVNHRPECAPGETCRGGSCTSDVVDPVEGAKDAGALPDAGNLDAALDAGGPFANILECAKDTVVWTPAICSAGAQKQCLAEAASRLFAACGATCTAEACCAPAANPDRRCCVEGKVPVLRPINPTDFNPQCPAGGLRACFSIGECDACGGKFEAAGMVGFGACSKP
jgi:hypothetical protein